MITLDVEQNSKEWSAARVGIPTSSNFDKIVTSKGAISKQYLKYMYRLAGERATGMPEETYQNGVMQRGNELEGEARDLYELISGETVEKVGLVYYDKKKKFACSPDGLVGQDGMLEIKCPLMHTHVGYLINGTLPADYIQQVQGQIFISRRKWCDFMSYYPGLRPLIVRVERDPIFIAKLEDELEKFCLGLDDVAKKVALPF